MSDVTRWVLAAGHDITTASGNLASIKGTADDPTIVILHADHLAALERVRGETLREVWAAVNREQAWSLSDAQMQTKCLAAIDRIIDATTTGATDA